MGYAQKNLMENERVVHVARPHGVIFIWSVLFASGAVGALIAAAGGVPHALWGAALLAGCGVVTLVPPLLRFSSSEFAVTSKRLIVKTGVFHVHSIDTLLTKVEAVSVDQGLVGRLLGYGTVTITGTGGTKESFHGIPKPLLFRMKVQEQIAGHGG